MSRKRHPIPTAPIEVEIEGLTHDGRGLAHVEGKTLFVDGALPGERVSVRYTRIQRRYDEGEVAQVLRASPMRIAPRCAHFGVCGGCRLQHLAADDQLRLKQDSLADTLLRIGKVVPERWLEPLTGPQWGYRHKARLGVRYVRVKGRTLVGFRERGGRWLADLSRCEVLYPAVGERLAALSALIDTLSIREQIPQIEVAVGEPTVVLVLRVLVPPDAADVARLTDFAAREGVHFYLQEGGPDSLVPLSGQAVELAYPLPDPRPGATGAPLRIGFAPTDFTQVNPVLNQRMVEQALALLHPAPEEQILDLFCGLGNFSLPLACRAAGVLGVEGDAALVARARANALANGVTQARFQVGDLYGDLSDQPWRSGRFDAALLDPPRSGAFEVLEALPEVGVERILYVSCYPSTLARDAERLVHGLGYRLRAAGVMDMFPQTAHVESMALFERPGRG